MATTSCQSDPGPAPGAEVPGRRRQVVMQGSYLQIYVQLCTYIPIGSMYAIYGDIYHQYTPNVSIYTINGSYGIQYYRLYGYGSIPIDTFLGGYSHP